MPSPQKRRKYTVAQAKNTMRRAIEEIVDPGPRNIDALWVHFGSRCGYCGTKLRRDKREGHADHAEPVGGNHLGNLVLACGSCNGDEKRDEPWREFLRKKAPDRAVLAERERCILAWFELHPPPRTGDSAEILDVRKELESVIQQFAVKCDELKKLVRHHARTTP